MKELGTDRTNGPMALEEELQHRLEQTRAEIARLDLLRHVLLHLPMYSAAELAEPRMLQAVIRRSVEALRARRAQAPAQWQQRVRAGGLEDLVVAPVHPELAVEVHQAFHYLGSPQREGAHLGAWTRGPDARLAALATISRLELRRARLVLPDSPAPEQVEALSRIYAFDGAPLNTLSWMLGRLFSWMRQNRPEVRWLVTQVNPNLGFRGSIYRATNWQLVAREHKTHYLYLDGAYVTDREMRARFGTSHFEALRERLRDRVRRSVRPLLPLELYAYSLAARRGQPALDNVWDLLPEERTA